MVNIFVVRCKSAPVEERVVHIYIDNVSAPVAREIVPMFTAKLICFLS